MLRTGRLLRKKGQLGRKKRSFVQRSGRRVEMDRLRRSLRRKKVVCVENVSIGLKTG